MEISRVNKAGVRQTVATTERKPEQGTASAGKSNRTDQLTLSKQALAYVEEQAKAALERGQGEADALTGREGSSEDSMLDALDKAMKEMKRCNKIAARIMAGDKVPPEDEQYLMTHDSNGYQLAMAMRRVKKDPKEHESELKDEEGGERTEAVSEGGSSAASPESPAEPPEVPAAPETAPES